MLADVRMCIDRPIPAAELAAAELVAIAENPANAAGPLEIAGIKQYFWRAGRTLKVRFLDGDRLIQAAVQSVALEWSKYANIRFEFGTDPDAEIRISFLQPGSWSYVGTYALSVPRNEPTMNFGWLYPETPPEELARVVLHEFGHALGCIHEHQHPENGIPWDVEKVYTYYAETQGWSRQMVDVNVLQAYNKSTTQYSEFDSRSIMLYPIANEMTVGDWEIPWLNSELSETDKSFIAQVYPQPTAFDAAVMAPNGRLYFFQGNRYFRFSPGKGVDSGFPRPIAGHWRGMPEDFAQGIDAALSLPDGKLYFLKGSDVVRYSFGIGVDDGYPRPISDEWPESNFLVSAPESEPVARYEDLPADQSRRSARHRTVLRHGRLTASLPRRFDLVFEGGGAKGIAFTGALAALWERGHSFARLMGTSAGAIMAALVAAGYDGSEMRRALEERDDQGRPVMATFLAPPPDFSPEMIEQSLLKQWLRSVDLPLMPDAIEELLDDWLLNALLKPPLYRRLFSFVETGGWFGAQELIAYLQRKLSEGNYRGRRRDFGDMTLLEFYHTTETDLSLLASDTTRGRLIVLNHRTAPDCPLVWAIRMSTSMPLLWQEVVWQEEWGPYRGHSISGNTVVDGGLLSSFPIELFITEQPVWMDVMGPKSTDQLIGMLIDEHLPVPGAPPRPGWDPEETINQFKPLRRGVQIVDTVLRARDKMVIEQYAAYVMRLPAGGYGTIEFSMSASRRAALIAAGKAAAEAYLDQLAEAPPAELSTLEMAAFTARADDVAARILGWDGDNT